MGIGWQVWEATKDYSSYLEHFSRGKQERYVSRSLHLLVVDWLQTKYYNQFLSVVMAQCSPFSKMSLSTYLLLMILLYEIGAELVLIRLLNGFEQSTLRFLTSHGGPVLIPFGKSTTKARRHNISEKPFRYPKDISESCLGFHKELSRISKLCLL